MATATIGTDRYKTEIVSSGHTIVADEPVGSGGMDLGPSPTEFISIALASCTAITLRMYADKKNIRIEKITVDVSSEKSGDSTLLLRKILLQGDLNEQQRNAMLKIANACPVHKTLTNPIEIKTTVSQ